MKRKFLFSILAVVPVMLMPLAAISQIAPERPRPEQTEPSYKWEIAAGYGYTSLNQVNQSRYGLQGPNFSVTRDWGKYFGLTADGGYYKYPLVLGGSGSPNPGDPSVYMALLGPVVHADLYGPVSILVRCYLGAEHTGGANENPDLSLAGGFGGGLEYRLSKRFAVRATGDEIGASFAEDPNHLGFSPHRRFNSRASLVVVYKF